MIKVYVPEAVRSEIGDLCSGITLAAGVPICYGSDHAGLYVTAPDADWATSLSALFVDDCALHPLTLDEKRATAGA